MVPRLRHRIGIETLRRELDAVHASSAAAAANTHSRHQHSITPPSSNSSSSPTASLHEDPWAPIGYLSVPLDSSANGHSQKYHNAAAVGDIIPGYRTSAAFLSSLRTNLRLHASPPPSPMSTPPSMRASASSLPAIATEPSPLSSDMDMATLTPPETPTNPLAGVPELNTYITSDEDEEIAALKLVTDSLAQMRQLASSILIYHPLNMAVFIAGLAVIYNLTYKSQSDIGIFFTTSAGYAMASLIFVRWLTGGYLFAAEDYAKTAAADVLDGADVLVTKFGDEVIGAVILGWKGVQPGGSPRDGQKGKRRKWRAEVRGWAVRIRYRNKGVGADLLEEAVQVAKSKGAESVGFAEDHANSTRVLWDFYNGAFDRKEKLARAKLQQLWSASPKGKKR